VASVAEFEVTYTVIRLSAPIAPEAPLSEFRTSLSRSIRDAEGRPSVTETWAIERAAIESTVPWLRSFDPKYASAESFATRCSSTIALVVTPRFHAEDLAARQDWLGDRLALVRKMVSQASCRA